MDVNLAANLKAQRNNGYTAQAQNFTRHTDKQQTTHRAA